MKVGDVVHIRTANGFVKGNVTEIDYRHTPEDPAICVSGNNFATIVREYEVILDPDTGEYYDTAHPEAIVKNLTEALERVRRADEKNAKSETRKHDR